MANPTVSSRPTAMARSGPILLTVGLVLVIATFVVGVDPVAADVPAGTGDTWRTTDGPIVPGSISAGPTHTCGVTTAGAAYCWGTDNTGQLGNGPATTNQVSPSPVATPAGVSWASITAGVLHTCAVTTTGAGYCWGDDFYGELGDGTPFDTDQSTPATIDSPSSASWTMLSAGYYSTCGVTTTGAAYCWGNDSNGKLGNGPASANQPSPLAVTTPAGVTWATISVGANSVCALTTAGAAYCWGFGGSGELGNGSTTPRETPVSVAAPSGVAFATISMGLDHACAVSTAGAAYCWGSDSRGQLGNGSAVTSNQATPDPVVSPGGARWARLSAGSIYSCGVTTTGAGYCWGDNFSGQLGIESSAITSEESPTLLSAPPDASWKSIVTDADHTCGVATDGLGYCWGNDGDGKLGNGPSIGATQLSPSRVGAEQTIDLPLVLLPTPPRTPVDFPNVHATSGLAVGATSITPTVCTVSEGGVIGHFVITPIGVGTCRVTFFQPGDAVWQAAEPADTAFAVAAASTTSTSSSSSTSTSSTTSTPTTLPPSTSTTPTSTSTSTTTSTLMSTSTTLPPPTSTTSAFTTVPPPTSTTSTSTFTTVPPAASTTSMLPSTTTRSSTNTGPTATAGPNTVENRAVDTPSPARHTPGQSTPTAPAPPHTLAKTGFPAGFLAFLAVGSIAAGFMLIARSRSTRRV